MIDLIIDDAYHKMQSVIYMREQRGSETYIIGYNGEELLYQRLGDTVSDKEFVPLLRIPMRMKPILLAAFIDEADKLKMRTQNEHAILGKLTATETHLNDMREMCKMFMGAVLSAPINVTQKHEK